MHSLYHLRGEKIMRRQEPRARTNFEKKLQKKLQGKKGNNFRGE